MKTIIVVYSNRKLSETEVAKAKKYAFNTEANLKVGDVLESGAYNTDLRVVKVLPASYTYYNKSTGELSDTYNSTAQWTIKKLIIREKDDAEVVYANKVEE